MNDHEFFSSQTFSTTEDAAALELGYSRKRKLAISVWLCALIACVALTYYCFALDWDGIDWFWNIQFRLMSNTGHGTWRHFVINLTLNPGAEYLGCLLSTTCGVMMLLMCIPRPIREHPVRSQLTRTGPSKALL